MTIFLAKGASGSAPIIRPLMAARGRPLLYAAIRQPGSSGGSQSTASLPTGVAAHWDASTTANMLASSGLAVVGWNAAVASIADTSGNSLPLSAYSYTAGATLPNSTARVNGLLGGVGLSTVSEAAAPTALSAGQYLPFMGSDQGWRAAGVSLTASADWTVHLVWTRPNRRQGGSTAPVTLVSAGSTAIVKLTGTAGQANTLSVFGTTISATMERRHSYSLILSYAHSTNQLSAYLTGNGTTINVTATASLGSGGLFTLLHDTTSGGGAQCWFHEAAVWTRALSGADVASLTSYSNTKYKLGSRKGFGVLTIGQSNAQYGFNPGAWHMLARAAAWYLGAAAYNVFGTTSTTMIGGMGIYPTTSADPAVLPGTFLTNPGDSGTAPLTDPWALNTTSGAMGGLTQSYIAGLSAEDISDIAAIWWPWSETDCVRLYSEKATVNAAQQRAVQLVRSFVGKSAAALPFATWCAMPFPYGTNDGGMLAMRESESDLANLSGFNGLIALKQACDVNPMGATINGNGTVSGGDNSHINTPDFPKLGVRAAPLIAAAVAASSGADAIPSIPAGAVRAGGPSITHVQQVTPTTYKLTIAHDAGNDLIIPQQAANGVGFSIMDGGTSASPGNIINATSCTYVDATHILVTIASAPTNQAASLKLYYPYGAVAGVGYGSSQHPGSGIGSGNAVTDNASSVTPPTGWDIGNQLGSTYSVNYPLASTPYGIAVSTN
jgi:hypothetical protein